MKRRRSQRINKKEECPNKKKCSNKESKSKNPDLPVEIMHEIFSYIHHFDRGEIACTSKYWNECVWDIPVPYHPLDDEGNNWCTCKACFEKVGHHNEKRQCNCPLCLTDSFLDSMHNKLCSLVNNEKSLTKQEKKNFQYEIENTLHEEKATLRYRIYYELIDEIKGKT